MAKQHNTTATGNPYTEATNKAKDLLLAMADNSDAGNLAGSEALKIMLATFNRLGNSVVADALLTQAHAMAGVNPTTYEETKDKVVFSILGLCGALQKNGDKFYMDMKQAQAKVVTLNNGCKELKPIDRKKLTAELKRTTALLTGIENIIGTIYLARKNKKPAGARKAGEAKNLILAIPLDAGLVTGEALTKALLALVDKKKDVLSTNAQAIINKACKA